MAENKVTYRIPKDKSSYVFSYRHPLVKDASGYGKKIQRGAGTSNESEMTKLAEQLQTLISDERWHHVSKRMEALEKFDKRVVEAFYDCMPNTIETNSALDVITLPSLEDGYANAALVGMSGCGKTTLLRKMMGTTKKGFPTTSTNRTTTCDMQIIRAKVSQYEMAVQFVARNEVESDLMDNLQDSIKYILTKNKEAEDIDDMELLLTILNHSEMSTRLTYTLGMPEVNDEEDEEDDDSFKDEDQDELFSLPDYEIDIEKKDKFLWELRDRVIRIAGKYTLEMQDEIDAAIAEDEDVLLVIDDIITAIIEKFDLLQGGKKTNPKVAWPEGWYFSTDNYDEFITKAKIFVSDSYKAWGKLLTPLVKAIRLKGPFVEAESDEVIPMVITDGIGLGHSTNSISVPASVLSRCAKADVIIFVDSAANPMMANAKEALKSLIEYGYADKIVFAFTKMDLVSGNNYRNLGDKKQHVFTTLKNYLMFLRKQENTVLSDSEVQSIMNNCIYFSYLNKIKISKVTTTGLEQLNTKIDAIVSKHISTDDVSFSYEALKLYYYIKESTLKFRKIWAEKTGYSCITNNTEHWTRIRALSRRLGLMGQENYCELQPLADFAAIVQENINIFINQPEKVTPAQTSEEVADELKRLIKRSIGEGFRELNRKRMWTNDDAHKSWESAYNEMGRGSRNRRARIIENIFDTAAPNLADIPNLTEEQELYLKEVITLVESVLDKYRCVLRRFNY
jgi:ABC-type oligopeptide transport system ATPase subunit